MTIRKQAVSGVKWTSVSTITLAVSALLKIAVLARFLDPADFGLMALITFVLGFMDLFMDMGITSAILHKQNITKKEYASLYWLNIGFSVLSFSVVALLSPLIASFYNELELTDLIPLSAVVILFSAIGRQYKTVFQKALRFKLIAIVDISSIVISLISAIWFAVFDFGVYALVYAALIQYGINNIAYFLLGVKNNPVLFHYKFADTKPFLKIGMYQVGGQVVNYINRDLDVLIIGKFFGAEILGGYSLAKQLVKRPTGIIDPIINKVAISILPRYQSDNNLLLKYFNSLIKNLCIVNAFVYGSIAIAAPFVVFVLYGSGYDYITVLVRLFSVFFYFRSVSSVVGVLSITKGRTDLEFYWNILIAIIMPTVMFFAVNQGTEIIATLIGVTQMLLVFPAWYMFYYKQIEMVFVTYIKNVFIPFFIAGLFFLLFYFSGFESVVFQIVCCLSLFGALSFYLLKTDKDVFKAIASHKYIKLFNKNKLRNKN